MILSKFYSSDLNTYIINDFLIIIHLLQLAFCLSYLSNKRFFSDLLLIIQGEYMISGLPHKVEHMGVALEIAYDAYLHHISSFYEKWRSGEMND